VVLEDIGDASRPGGRARPASKRCGSSKVFGAVAVMGKS
jgi:hypothetical protein